MSEKEDGENGNGKAQDGDQGCGDNGLLRILVVSGAVFGDQPGNGQRNSGSGCRREHGEDGKSDLIDAHAFRAESSGQNDSV